jgi:hypothetical protein
MRMEVGQTSRNRTVIGGSQLRQAGKGVERIICTEHSWAFLGLEWEYECACVRWLGELVCG